MKDFLLLKVEEKNYAFFANTGLFAEISEIAAYVLDNGDIEEKEIIEKFKNDYDEAQIKNEIYMMKKFVQKQKENCKGNIVKDRYKGYENMDFFAWKKNHGFVCLWLDIAYDCNLKCRYCFGDGGDYGRKRELMTEDKAKKCIDFWLEHLSPHAKYVYITFFGGEPLLNYKVLKYATEYIESSLNGKDITIIYSLTTNGTIYSDEIADFLLEHNINPLISIDGIKKIQDRNRPFNSGKGSYSIVKENVNKYLKKFEFLRARMTVTKEDVPYFKQSVEHIWNMGIPYVMYDLVASTDTELMVDEKDLQVLKKQILDLEEISYNNIITGKNEVLWSLIKPAKKIHEADWHGSCSLCGLTTVVFDPQGCMFKCHRLAGSPKFEVGTIDKGIDWGKFNDRFDRNTPLECEKCWARAVCQEGCPQIRLTYNNTVERNYPLWCEHNKFIIERSLNLYSKLYKNDEKNFKRFFK